MLDHRRNYELTVRPLGRTVADEYYHNGAMWVEGREGNNYTIDVRNHTAYRALFIISVDGLDVLEGKPAGLQSQGYIVDPNSTISIPGWKVSNQKAAEFFFSRTQDSYVNAIGGNTSNTGVIGAMVFAEQQHSYIDQHWGSIASLQSIPKGAMPLMSAGSNSMSSLSGGTRSLASQEVGTGFGAATPWNTVAAQFIRANPSNPDAILALYYNTAKNLEKMGIVLRKKRDVSYRADPFPAYTYTSSGGCKPPSDWNE